MPVHVIYTEEDKGLEGLVNKNAIAAIKKALAEQKVKSKRINIILAIIEFIDRYKADLREDQRLFGQSTTRLLNKAINYNLRMLNLELNDTTVGVVSVGGASKDSEELQKADAEKLGDELNEDLEAIRGILSEQMRAAEGFMKVPAGEARQKAVTEALDRTRAIAAEITKRTGGGREAAVSEKSGTSEQVESVYSAAVTTLYSLAGVKKEMTLTRPAEESRRGGAGVLVGLGGAAAAMVKQASRRMSSLKAGVQGVVKEDEEEGSPRAGSRLFDPMEAARLANEELAAIRARKDSVAATGVSRETSSGGSGSLTSAQTRQQRKAEQEREEREKLAQGAEEARRKAEEKRRGGPGTGGSGRSSPKT